MGGCVPTRYLAEDENLLVSIKPVGLQNVDPVTIQALYQQKPNRMVFGSTPYLSLYNFGKKFYNPERIDKRITEKRARMRSKIKEENDSLKIRDIRTKYDNQIANLTEKKKNGNFVMQLGEPPAIYDSAQMVRTMQQIDVYLDSKGYFNHTASFTENVKGKLMYVTLNIQENTPFRYSELTYGITDTALLNVVQKGSQWSLLKPGDVYDADVLSKERDRLNNRIRNYGYYDFARAYIVFDVDTSYAENTARIKTIIQNPENDSTHKVYTIRQVYFKTDNDRFGIPRDTTHFQDINYISYKLKYSPRVLDTKVDIYPGQVYSQLRTNTTQRKLANLDVFQFSNVTYNKLVNEQDSTATNELNAFINAIPSKKFQETAELGLTYTERIPGPFSSIRLRTRNVFGGAENLDIGLRGGFEGQVGLVGKETTTIKEFGGDVSLSFPLILLPFTGRNLLSDSSPRTRIYTGYTSHSRSEYKRSTSELGIDYIWQKGRNVLLPPTTQFIVSPVNLNVVQVDRLSDEFLRTLREYSQDSRSLEESFKSAFISFMSFNFIYNTNDFTQSRDARYFRSLVEVGGLTQELGIQPKFGTLRTFQYAKINPDYRRYIPLGGKRFFIYKINVGVGSPIFSSNVMPYDKYFFAGGASSVRAWQSRRLGPGSFATVVANPDIPEGEEQQLTRDFTAEQPGEILIEGSAEYRFNMFSFLNGALFVDAGNVWLMRPDQGRPGADFAFNRFYKELAVGTGFGFRFDLSVLVLRFDLATKVYDPAGVDGKKFILNNFRFSDFFTQSNQSTLNIGIGYPF
uniref:translocation and assembly module lipoprotein TamL n=1 Tax=Pontibacter arcticus TaxID=2080288 RepID=UPI001EF01D7C|nr:BamA/TamA family outer membrane protein [Pontibacter arcticus]